ncbi:MAG: EamA family transporter [Fibrobacter sp.]|nr:EamA family transporter [Fibrobacter sp.]
MWKFYAILSALFAALTAIFAKIGIENINSNLATAIRTVVILLVTFGIVYFTGVYNQISNISHRSWIFLILSGIATGLSWLFYFKAIQLGNVSKVAPIDKFSIVITMLLACIFLKEALTWKMILGGILITLGTIFLL